VSPQAPIADWFRGDDMHRHGALNLAMAFNFFHSFGQPRPKPTDQRGWKEPEFGTPDGYQFFLQLGSLKNVNENSLKNASRSGTISSRIRITTISGKAAICCHT
jgi:hypothetical protein